MPTMLGVLLQAAWIEAEKDAVKRAESRAADLAAREARLAAKEEALAAQQQVGRTPGHALEHLISQPSTSVATC